MVYAKPSAQKRFKDEGSFAKLKARLKGFEVVATAPVLADAIAYDSIRGYLCVIAEQVLVNLCFFVTDHSSSIIQQLWVVVGPGDVAIAAVASMPYFLRPFALGTDQRPGSAENRGASGLRVDQTLAQVVLPYAPTLVLSPAIAARALPLMPA